jgi:PAS domain S-box-containing protein
MPPKSDIANRLRNELAETRARLAEMEEALDAIRHGEVDGLVVAGPEGQQVFTLQGAQEPYRLLIEHMSEGALTLSAQGVILYANQTFASLLQTPLESVIGLEFRSLVDESDPPALIESMKDGWHGTRRGEVTVRAADGSLVRLRLGLSQIQVESEDLICVVATDLTETSQKEAELRSFYADLEKRVSERTADLAASRLAALNMMEDAVAARQSAEHAQAELARLGAAVQQTADSIVITDVEGRIEYVNPAFERITGYSRDEALGQNPRILKSPKNDPAVYRDLWETITSGNVWVGQLINRKKDGSDYTERVTISAVHDEAGRIVNYIAVKQDTTAQAQLEEQLRQSQKLEAIGQLAGGVAHDFNNLLTVIGGYSSILLGKLPADSPHRASVEEIKKAGDRAGALTRQLLAFSRKQILQPKVLNLNTVVTDLEKMVRRLIGEDIDVLTIKSPVLGQIRADPGQIEQVLLNLIVNARDAMPQGGKLTIETRNVILSEEAAQRRAAPAGSYVTFSVSDTGQGMDAAIQPRIFDPFFTTKGSGKGTGLGLATVYGIVKQSGGHIWVYSEVGSGSVFKIFLPRLDQPPESELEAVAKEVPHGTELILLVEDEDQVRAILQHILEEQGYHVLAASNGAEALVLAQEPNRDIRLMITDVVMPQMGGRELAEQILVTRPLLPVLFMSGYTDDAIVRLGLLDQKINFIQKPFDSAAVARKVREVLDQRLEPTRPM